MILSTHDILDRSFPILTKECGPLEVHNAVGGRPRGDRVCRPIEKLCHETAFFRYAVAWVPAVESGPSAMTVAKLRGLLLRLYPQVAGTPGYHLQKREQSK